MRVVVIGTGPAGITAAETVRSLDQHCEITMVSTEPFAPYSPAAMADHFLTGRVETLYWKGTDVADRLGIDERRNTVVRGVDTDTREVVLEEGPPLPYDALVVASGSRLHAPIEGADLPGLFDFKSLRVASALVDRVRRGEARSALIVGNGFIGVELSLLLSDLGVDVTILGRRPWLMPRVLDRESSSIVEGAVSARGVRLRLGVEATAFVGDGEVHAVRMADGTELRSDLFIAATGVKPHVEFLAGSGVVTGWGVHVDDELRTSAPGVTAAGDAAEAADWLTGERYVHAIFANAVAQGSVAGANALGLHRRYAGAEAMNSLKHLGVPVVAMGTTEGANDVVRTRRGDALRTVYLRGGHIIGAQLAGDIRGAGVYHALMLRQADVGRLARRLEAPDFGMADVVWDGLRALAAG